MEYQKFVPEGWIDKKENITWDSVNSLKENGKVITGYVESCDSNYNLKVDLGNGIYGIIPRNEADALEIDEFGYTKKSICQNKVNSYVSVKIKEVYQDKNLILSRKAVGNDAIHWMKNELKEGDVLNGIVKNIRGYGAFIEIGGGLVGLLPIENISVSRIKSPAERFKIGQKINVMIKSIEKNENRVFLTYKELLGSWEENVKDYQIGTTVKGIVREVEKYKNGIFVELKPNLVGLAEYKEGYTYGQTVDVYIKKIQHDKKKIKLILV